MLGQIDLAHAAGADSFLEVILSKLPGAKRLAAQRADGVNAEGGPDGADDEQQRGLWNVHRVGGHAMRTLVVGHPQRNHHRDGRRRHRAQHQAGAAPSIGDEQGISEHQEDPGAADVGQEALGRARLDMIGLQQQKKARRQAEDEQFAHAEHPQRALAAGAEHGADQTQHGGDDHLGAEQVGPTLIGRGGPLHEPQHKKGGEARKQQQRGRPQPATEQIARLAGQMRTAPFDQPHAGPLGLIRPLRCRGRRRRVERLGKRIGTFCVVVHAALKARAVEAVVSVVRTSIILGSPAQEQAAGREDRTAEDRAEPPQFRGLSIGQSELGTRNSGLGTGDRGPGIGDWGLGIGDWARNS